MENPIAFLLASAALLVTPGPTNTLLATAGAVTGGRRPVDLLVAEVVGYMISINVMALLILPLIGTSPIANVIVKAGCPTYLCYASWRMFRSREAILRPQTVVRARDVFVTTLLNPKGAIFAIFIVPFLGKGLIAASLPYLAGLVLLIAVVGGGWYMLGATIARGAGPRLNSVIIRRCGATVLAVYAVMLTMSAMKPFLG